MSRALVLLTVLIAAVLCTSGTPAAHQAIDALIQEMSLRKQVSQRFIGYLTGTEVDERTAALIREAPLGGFIFFPYNVRSAEQTAMLTAELSRQTAAASGGIKPLICVDQEGGRVVTLQFEPALLPPSAAQIAAQNQPRITGTTAEELGRRLLELGVTMNLAPVADVYPTPDRSIIGDRSFGGDPEVVSEHVVAYLDGMRRAGVVSAVKHFPGHGITTVDSHGRLPVVTDSLTVIRERDLVPFARAVAGGAPVVMAAHILYQAVDPRYPATVSEVLLHRLLREELGFNGLIMTDAIEMHALSRTYSQEELIHRLFELEVDLILVGHHYDVEELIDTAVEMVQDGRIGRQALVPPLRRILALKYRYGLIGQP